jgi:hypothetical protein
MNKLIDFLKKHREEKDMKDSKEDKDYPERFLKEERAIAQ